MSLLLLLSAVFVAALGGTALLRRYALSHRVIDVPNERSSHQVPTPRGGGVAVVLATLAASAILMAMGRVDGRTTAALVLGGGVVAAIGFVDDHRHVPARWRLLAHFAAGTLAVVVLEPWRMFGASAASAAGLAVAVVSVVGLVWSLNLFNFMDGIDGIAGVQAVTVGAGAALVAIIEPPASDWISPAVLAAAAAGFLLWNFPPARIFMGDSGSGFLGFAVGVFALAAGRTSPAQLASWMILMAVFFADASVTLLRRMAQGERVHEAHRSHAYQHAARRFSGHRPVTLAVAAINVFWLLPCAIAVVTGRLPAAVGLGLAYLPLIALVLLLGAGRRAS